MPRNARKPPDEQRLRHTGQTGVRVTTVELDALKILCQLERTTLREEIDKLIRARIATFRKEKSIDLYALIKKVDR